jgi:uncharacterized protein YjbI with pentapeptide repeats
MDENHQDKTESKLITTEDVRWGVNRKSKLWVPKHKKRTGFEGKTLWDWLQLLAVLAIPLILGLATLLFGIQQANLAQQQHENDQKIANQQRLQDQAIVLDQQRQATLVKYQDDMRDFLLKDGLLTSKPGDEIRVIALTETLSAMRQLDAKRNSFLILFLQNAHLNGVYNPDTGASYNIVNFDGADLSTIDFNGAELFFVNFNGAGLSNAYLGGADLRYATLSRATLIHTDLTDATLSSALNLTQQQLDQVLTCKGATLPKGLTCHHNQ